MNRDPRGYYAALGVTPDATAAEIQRAFRALMRLRHPDVDASSTAGQGPGNNEGDDARRILESFAVLRDPRSRAEYDPAAASGGPGRTSPRRPGDSGASPPAGEPGSAGYPGAVGARSAVTRPSAPP